jgi:hypothetical protein
MSKWLSPTVCVILEAVALGLVALALLQQAVQFFDLLGVHARFLALRVMALPSVLLHGPMPMQV